MEWPNVVLVLGLLLIAFCVFVAVVAMFDERRKDQLKLGREDDLMQLVKRYEQLAEKTMDAQQRIATDVAELRARAGSIEQILRSVE